MPKKKKEENKKPEVIKLTTLKSDKEKKALKRVANQFLKSKADSLFKSAFESRERYDWEWLTRDLFRRGYHFSNYDQPNKTVLLATRRGVKFPVNLLWSQMRGVKNMVTNFKPKWEVLPTGKSEESLANARYSGKLLDYYYQHLGLRKMLKETVMQGLMFSVGGPWQIGYDKETGEAYIWLIDTYDFYVDPLAPSLKDAQFCVKAVRKNLDEVTTNPHYKFYESIPKTGEPVLAVSPAKQFLIQALKHKTGNTKEEEEEGAILKEAWIKTRVSDDNIDEIKEELAQNEEDTKNLKNGEVLMRIVHFTDFLQDPLLVQLKRRNDFPFALYQGDINPCELYGESWAKHIIPINRVLNALESSVFMFNYMVAVGRVIIDKNSGVRLVANQHGSFIEKNRGADVKIPQPPSAPPSFQQQIANCWKYIEDLGGLHEPSYGKLPSNISGIALAELKQADASNSSDLTDNLEEFLVEVGQKTLKVVSQNYDVPKLIKDLGMGGDVKHFAVVGESGAGRRSNKRKVKIGPDSFDLAVIGSDNEIRVTIGSWLAYTKTARQERLESLFEKGAIDQKTLLQHCEFADVDNIIEKTRQEEILKQFRKSNAQGAEVSDEEIARQENAMMLQGNDKVEPLVTDNHIVHNIVHQEALGAGGNPIIEKHMSLHEALAEKHPEGEQAPAQTPIATPAPTPGVAGMTTPPPGAPAGGTPGSPEEAALMESLAGLQGGQGGQIR